MSSKLMTSSQHKTDNDYASQSENDKIPDPAAEFDSTSLELPNPLSTIENSKKNAGNYTTNYSTSEEPGSSGNSSFSRFFAKAAKGTIKKLTQKFRAGETKTHDTGQDENNNEDEDEYNIKLPQKAHQSFNILLLSSNQGSQSSSDPTNPKSHISPQSQSSNFIGFASLEAHNEENPQPLNSRRRVFSARPFSSKPSLSSDTEDESTPKSSRKRRSDLFISTAHALGSGNNLKTPSDVFSASTNAIGGSSVGLARQRTSSMVSTQSRHSVVETNFIDHKVEDIDGHGQVNQYLIVKDIGQGSFGSVKLCMNMNDKMHYAMKMISKKRLKKKLAITGSAANMLGGGRARRRLMSQNASPQSGDGVAAVAAAAMAPPRSPSPTTNSQQPLDFMSHIKGEIAILKKISNHPNITSLIEVLDDEKEDMLYMIFELCENGPVINIKLNDKTYSLGEEKSRKYMRDIILGLEYLHYKKIIHRDLKPENILLDASNTAKIADFGISTLVDEGTADSVDIKISDGSPAFMSPESLTASANMVKNFKLQCASDMWSLGITLYCMTHGKCPFESPSIITLYDMVLTEKPVIDANLSFDLRDILTRLLEKDPSKRLTMEEVKTHPWITLHGTMPMPSTEENCERDDTVTEEEVNKAVKPALSFLSKILSKLGVTVTGKQSRRPSSSGFGSSNRISNGSMSFSGASGASPTSPQHANPDWKGKSASTLNRALSSLRHSRSDMNNVIPSTISASSTTTTPTSGITESPALLEMRPKRDSIIPSGRNRTSGLSDIQRYSFAREPDTNPGHVNNSNPNLFVRTSVAAKRLTPENSGFFSGSAMGSNPSILTPAALGSSNHVSAAGSSKNISIAGSTHSMQGVDAKSNPVTGSILNLHGGIGFSVTTNSSTRNSVSNLSAVNSAPTSPDFQVKQESIPDSAISGTGCPTNDLFNIEPPVPIGVPGSSKEVSRENSMILGIDSAIPSSPNVQTNRNQNNAFIPTINE